MKSYKLMISILLLLALGFALGGEAFGESKHIIACESEFSFSSPDASSAHTEYQQNCGEKQQEQHSQKCSDPCHVGQGHFGHCSFLTSQSELHFQAFELKDTKRGFSHIVIESPTLEGLRRPPRQS